MQVRDYRNILTSAAIAVLCSWLVAIVMFAGYRSGQTFISSDTLYTQVRSKGEIRAAYNVGAPLFTIDPNTKVKSGIFYDVMTVVGRRLGLRVDWTAEVGYGEMVEGLRSRRYDIVGSGVWINSDRSKGADFTNPVYYDAVFPYTRTGDTRLQGRLSDLNGSAFTISTMDGELGASIAQQDFPKAKVLDLPQNSDFSQLIANVVAGKADVVFLAQGPARAYETVNPGKIVALGGPVPVRVFPNSLMIPPNQYELKAALDHTLEEMQDDGTIDSILKRYEAVPDTFLRLALPYKLTKQP